MQCNFGCYVLSTMVESSPRRVAVSAHDASIQMPLDIPDDDEGPLRITHQGNATKYESVPNPGESRWKKLRTTVQLGNAVAHHRKPPLKREDSFLKRFSTRPPNIFPQENFPERPRYAWCPVLNPDESLLFGWLWCVTVCGLYNSWTLIAREAFPELQYENALLWTILDWFTDCVYCSDVLVQFRTGYLEQGIMVRDAKRLARHYVTSRDFVLDIAALLPLGFLGHSPLLRFPRFLKARRIYKFYYAVESRTAYPNLWRVANLIHVLLLLAHWFGCFYYMLSELEGFEGAWAYRHPEKPEPQPLVRKYLGSVYWSTLTLTTIGDLATPATNLQYIFTIISYLIGVFIFATIVGQVGNVITNRNASRLEFERLLDGAKLYMRHHKVPKGMQRRVQRWYGYSWSRGRMQGGGDIHSALGILPDKLKTELAIHVNLKTLKKVSIFQECQPEFLHDLVLKMRAYIFTPGDLVCRKGEVAREMFIIADGILQVINERGEVLTHMQAGDFFGEIGILNLDGFNRRTADVRSVGYSELFSLSREDVLSAMKDYPEAEDILQTMGRRRLLEARLANSSEKDDDSDSGCLKNENRSRKKGISLAYLLRKKDTRYVPQFQKPKYSPGNHTVDKVSRADNSNSLLHQINHIPSQETQKNPCLVQQITSKFRKRRTRFRQRRHTSTWWYKISHLVHLKRKRSVLLTEPERLDDTKVTKKSCDNLPKPEESRCPELKKELKETCLQSRRTSYQLSKPSVSNWNRSELLSHARDPLQRRKTLAEGNGLFGLERKSSHEKVPFILMTSHDLKSEDEFPPDDISPMSSNFSLTPSTTENDQEEDNEKHKELPPEIRKAIRDIVLGIKDYVDEFIFQSERETIEEIVQMKERIQQQDRIIKCLEELSTRPPKQNLPASDEPKPQPSVMTSSPNRQSADSAVSSMDLPSPGEMLPDVKLEEEDLWLVEFPPSAPSRQKLRRHSSVEVGHELPFRLASFQKFPASDSFLKLPQDTRPLSPRRFSESQLGPDVVPLNTSFAAKVRRVLSKVRVSTDSPENCEEDDERKVEKRCDGKVSVRRFLPTIAESGSFDSLRDSPHSSAAASPMIIRSNTPVVINIPTESDFKD